MLLISRKLFNLKSFSFSLNFCRYYIAYVQDLKIKDITIEMYIFFSDLDNGKLAFGLNIEFALHFISSRE